VPLVNRVVFSGGDEWDCRAQIPLHCWRRLNFDHLCRLNLDQGLLLV
jgi:hypothetical protein